MIRVAWNLLWLRPGVVGGSEEYATRQLEALADHAEAEVRVTAFVLQPFLDAHPELASRVDCRAVRLSGTSKPLRIAAEASWLAGRTRRGFDLVHHLGGRIPAIAPGPRVLTVHDLQPLEQPENFSMAKRLFLGRALPRSVARADLVVTPSVHVASRVVEVFRVDSSQVRAIAAPVTATAAADRDAAGPRLDAGLLAKHPELRGLLNGGAPFFLYPAITYAHKNHMTLLNGFAQVRRTRPDARLVLSGGVGGCEEAVLARIAAPDLEGAVVRIGRVEREVLDALIRQATALVFPSEFEGFGLPVVEALAAGCPVIVSNIEVLREVAGDAATFVGPDDAAGWANAMIAAQHGAANIPGAASGRAVAARFGPKQTAAALVDAYRSVSGW